MGFVQRDDEPVELPGGVTEGAGMRTLREPIRDQPGERLRRGVHAREGRLVVEISIVELRHDGAQLLGRSTDVDHDAVGVELRAPERGVDDVGRAVERLRGPNVSPRRLWAIIMWSRTVTLNTLYPSP